MKYTRHLIIGCLALIVSTSSVFAHNSRFSYLDEKIEHVGQKINDLIAKHNISEEKVISVLKTKQRESEKKKNEMNHYIFTSLISLLTFDTHDGFLVEDVSHSTAIDTTPRQLPARNRLVLIDMKKIFDHFDHITVTADDEYFYVHSNWLPHHDMMVGITNRQQQVPLPQDYTDHHAWAIPRQPELADQPISTSDNFWKWAIAVAANGVPIFNPRNNRGEDTFAMGELDRRWGHAGKADDYHYHLPPVHLQSIVGDGNPIGYALDGFPLYGYTNQPLDEYLGRFDEQGHYQYHTIRDFPYFIAGFRGKVTINSTTTEPENEISPQPKSFAIRLPLQPLRWAEITSFERIDDTTISLTYRLDSATHRIEYTRDTQWNYSFTFTNPDGSVKDFQTYHK